MSDSTSAICKVDDRGIVCEILAARERITFVAPGISKEVADAIASAWPQLGGSNVSVILDVDPEVCRLGYGTLKGLETVQKAAQEAGQSVWHQAGIRIGVLITDATTTVFSPTPLLVEAGSPREDHPNAIRLSAPPAALADDLGIGDAGDVTRKVGMDGVPPKRIEELKQDLDRNPPAKFDIARKVRVFNAQLEFVEFKLEGCFVSRKTASLSPELMGLAEDEATKERLHGTFKVLSESDIVDEGSKLSEKKLREERKRIADRYLTSIKGFGTVILRSNKEAFEKEVDGLEKLVGDFQTHLRSKLDTMMKNNAKRLADALFPSVKAHPPERWVRILGQTPSEEDLQTQLLHDIRDAFGDVEKLMQAMTVEKIFKGVTYETLTNPAFLKLAQKQFPSLRLHDEYDAARETA